MKRYTSGFITADDSLSNILIPNAGAPASGKLYSIGEHLQYKNAGYLPVVPGPPFPIYTSLSYSNYFDGTGDYLSVPTNIALDFSTGDFTVEGWVLPNALASDWFFISASGSGGFFVGYSSTTILGFGFGRAGVAWDYRVAGSATVGVWQHVAVTRSGTSMRIFVNGTQVGTTQTISTAYNLGTTSTTIGSQGANYYLNGYISNLRVVKGTAVYTANFTPSTTPLTAIANTSLLTCQSSTIIDNGPNAFTITVTGDTNVFAFNPFGPNIQAAYLAVAGGGGGGGQGGGGGAGGLLNLTNLILVPNVTYTITVGAGALSTSPGSSFGSNTRITTAGFAANITAVGGGAGQSRDVGVPGGIGGSGGGGGAGAAGGSATGAAGTSGQGNSGAPGGYPGSGGGGGGGAGAAGNPGAIYGGNGGAGVYLTISGSNVAYAGGGGGGGVSGYNNGGGAGGIGGGGGASHGTTGGGGSASGTLSNTAVSGTYGPGAVNTGGGGGGGAVAAAGLGGSGVVILASNTYEAANVTGNPNVTYTNGNTLAIYRFWQSGTIRW